MCQLQQPPRARVLGKRFGCQLMLDVTWKTLYLASGGLPRLLLVPIISAPFSKSAFKRRAPKSHLWHVHDNLGSKAFKKAMAALS